MKTVSEQMELARKAQAIVNDYTQEQIYASPSAGKVYEDENIAARQDGCGKKPATATSRAKIIAIARSAACCTTSRAPRAWALIERNEETGISNTPSFRGRGRAILPATNPTAVRRQGRRHPQRPQRRHLQAQFPRAEKAITEAIRHDARGSRKVGAPGRPFRCLKIRAAKPSPNS